MVGAFSSKWILNGLVEDKFSVVETVESFVQSTQLFLAIPYP